MPTNSQNNEVLLKLSIKGFDPAEAQRIAAASADVLTAELRASMERQAALYRTAAETQNAQSRAYAQQEIKEQRAKAQAIIDLQKQASSDQVNAIRNERTAAKAAVDAGYAALLQARRNYANASTEEARRQAQDEVTTAENTARRLADGFNRLKDEHKAAMVGMQTNWRAWLEVGENATTVLTGVFGVIRGGYQRFKELAAEVSRTTQIFQSNHVSVDLAREAIDKTATSLELITAANKAAQLDLNITAQQFADIARQAKSFADAVGIDSAEALDSLATGIANGNEKLLKHAGIKIDAQKAEEEYAKKLHVTTEDLGEQGKKFVIQNLALAELSRRTREAKNDLQGPVDVSHTLEKALAAVSETWNKFVLSLGSIQIDPELPKMFEFLLDVTKGLIEGLTNGLPSAIRLAAAAMKDAIHPFSDKSFLTEEWNRQIKETLAADSQIAKDRKVAAEKQAAADKNALLARAEVEKQISKDAQERAAVREAKADANKSHPITSFDKAIRGVMQSQVAARDELFAQQRELDDFLNDPFGYDVGQQGRIKVVDMSYGFDKNSLEGLYSGIDEAAKQKLNQDVSKLLGSNIGQGTDSQQKDLQQATDVARQQIAKIEAELDPHKNQREQNTEQLGILSKFFGPDFLNKSREEMDELERITFDSTQAIAAGFAQAGQAMAMGWGHATAAAIADGKNLKAGLRDATHDVLENLAAQSIGLGLMELAKAAAAEAAVLSGQVEFAPAVGAHLTAAAAFGAVGVGAAVAARAVGHSATGGSTSTRGNDFTSTSSRGSADGGGTSNVTLNIYVPVGGEAEAGRSIVTALDAYKAQTGKDLTHLVSRQ